jgi:CubicO group peptidase (beta-lactamase class C family)
VCSSDLKEIGTGYRGRTVADVLAMNVYHEFDEFTAYNAKPGTRLREMLDIEESTLGWEPSKITKLSRRQFIAQFKAGHEDGSNENRTGKYFYTTANTDLGAWIVENATGRSTQATVRDLLHAIGGENTVYISTDRTGVPIVGGGLIMTPRDWARHGMLLANGGQGVSGEKVGGGMDWVKKTMADGKVSVGNEGWHYINGVYASQWGIGHPGWGGQWVFGDPESETVVAVFAGLMGPNPADLVYGKMVMDASEEVAEYQRKKN